MINESQTMLVFDYLAKFFGTLMGVIIGLILNNNSLKNKRYLVNSKPQEIIYKYSFTIRQIL